MQFHAGCPFPNFIKERLWASSMQHFIRNSSMQHFIFNSTIKQFELLFYRKKHMIIA